MTSITQDLNRLDASRKRWMTRLTRAHTALKELDRKRQRLLKKQFSPSLGMAAEEVIPTAIAPEKLSTETVVAPPKDYDAIEAFAKAVVEAPKEDGLDIPKELRVTADVEALRAQRRKAEEAERKKMPLNEREALKHIRKKK